MRRFVWLRILAVKGFRQNSNIPAWKLGGKGVRGSVQAVLGRQEHGSSGEHDCGVVEHPRVVERDEVVNSLSHEGVTLLGKHEIVGDANRNGFGEDDGVGEERVEWAETADVQVEIDTSIMVQNEITNSVGTLNSVGVTVEGIQEPVVMFSDEFTGTCICPELVFAAGESKLKREDNWGREHTSRDAYLDSPERR